MISRVNAKKSKRRKETSSSVLSTAHRSSSGVYSSSLKSKRREKVVISYGIILFMRNKDTGINFLLYKRRETYDYMEFLVGNWKTIDRATGMFVRMTHEERDRIRNYTFDELWKDLWVYHNFRYFREGYDRAYRQYNIIKRYIPHILDATSTDIDDLPWAFPKGKKNQSSEPGIDCALREFKEETRFDTSDFIIHRYGAPYREIYRGSNGKLYSTYYYLAETNSQQQVRYMNTPHCIRKKTVTSEALDVKWMTYEEASISVSRNRRMMLKMIYNLLYPY